MMRLQTSTPLAEEASMSEDKKQLCTACAGKKVLKGECVCDMEWRGSGKGDDWEECQCTPDWECTVCSGTGYVDAS